MTAKDAYIQSFSKRYDSAKLNEPQMCALKYGPEE